MSELSKEILKVASKSIKEVQKESLRRGIANVYSKNQMIYFQLPDGTITQKIPKEYKETDDK